MNETFAFSDLCRRVANLIRIGKIAEVDGAQVKVQIGKVKTNLLPIVSMAGDTSIWIPITVGEQVAVISPYGEMAQSFVIRSLHYNKYAAPENKNDIFLKTKSDVKAESEGKFAGEFKNGFELKVNDTYIYVHEDNAKIKCKTAEVSISDDRISCNLGNSSVISENDRITLNAGGASITLSSSGIRLSCGASTIDISDSNISLNSSSISTMPQIIEELSFEEILLRMKEALVVIDQEYTAYLESDPLIKLMEVAAYRELLLRQRINHAAKANLLAFAAGSDLDNLSLFYGITRKENETDEELRARTHAKIVGWSSAGSREAYKFHALNSDSRVREANADSPEPGLVRISVLSKENGGVVSADLLESVNNYMQREDIRMLTDTVEVVPCGLIEVNVKAKIILMSSTPPEILNTIKASFISAFNKIAGLGVSISRVDGSYYYGRPSTKPDVPY